MGKYAIIVAVDEQMAIGRNNGMLAHLPGDLKYFKQVTLDHTVIMGRNTYESLPKGALPQRRNIVLSRDKQLQLPQCEMSQTIQMVLEMTEKDDFVFFIGGGQIYKEVLECKLVDKLYITRIHEKFDDPEVFFPKIDLDGWNLTWSEKHYKDDRNAYDYTFEQYSQK